MQRFYKPILHQFIHGNMIDPYILKNCRLFNIIPQYWVSFAPNKKRYQNPKGGVLLYFHVHKSRNYSWDPPLDLALISRSLIRSLSTELDCSHSLSEIGESTPGLDSGLPNRFKGCTCAGVGWDSKGGIFKESLTAGFRITEKDEIFFLSIKEHKS